MADLALSESIEALRRAEHESKLRATEIVQLRQERNEIKYELEKGHENFIRQQHRMEQLLKDIDQRQRSLDVVVKELNVTKDALSASRGECIRLKKSLDMLWVQQQQQLDKIYGSHGAAFQQQQQQQQTPSQQHAASSAGSPLVPPSRPGTSTTAVTAARPTTGGHDGFDSTQRSVLSQQPVVAGTASVLHTGASHEANQDRAVAFMKHCFASGCDPHTGILRSLYFGGAIDTESPAQPTNGNTTTSLLLPQEPSAAASAAASANAVTFPQFAALLDVLRVSLPVAAPRIGGASPGSRKGEAEGPAHGISSLSFAFGYQDETASLISELLSLFDTPASPTATSPAATAPSTTTRGALEHIKVCQLGPQGLSHVLTGISTHGDSLKMLELDACKFDDASLSLLLKCLMQRTKVTATTGEEQKEHRDTMLAPEGKHPGSTEVSGQLVIPRLDLSLSTSNSGNAMSLTNTTSSDPASTPGGMLIPSPPSAGGDNRPSTGAITSPRSQLQQQQQQQPANMPPSTCMLTDASILRLLGWTGLIHLDLSNHALVDLSVLQPILHVSPQLEYLGLRNCVKLLDGPAVVAHPVPPVTAFTESSSATTNNSNNNARGSVSVMLPQALEQNNNSQNQTSQFCAMINKLQHLKELDIRGTMGVTKLEFDRIEWLDVDLRPTCVLKCAQLKGFKQPLTGNSIQVMSWWTPKLEVLSVVNCSVDERMFKQLAGISILNALSPSSSSSPSNAGGGAGENAFGATSNNATTTANLKQLYFVNCKLRGLGILLTGLRKLQVLSTHGCSGLTDHDFASLPLSLEVVDLCGNYALTDATLVSLSKQQKTSKPLPATTSESTTGTAAPTETPVKAPTEPQPQVVATPSGSGPAAAAPTEESTGAPAAPAPTQEIVMMSNLRSLSIKNCTNMTDGGLLLFTNHPSLESLNVLGTGKKISTIAIHRLCSTCSQLQELIHESVILGPMNRPRSYEEDAAAGGLHHQSVSASPSRPTTAATMEVTTPTRHGFQQPPVMMFSAPSNSRDGQAYYSSASGYGRDAIKVEREDDEDRAKNLLLQSAQGLERQRQSMAMVYGSGGGGGAFRYPAVSQSTLSPMRGLPNSGYVTVEGTTPRPTSSLAATGAPTSPPPLHEVTPLPASSTATATSPSAPPATTNTTA